MLQNVDESRQAGTVEGVEVTAEMTRAGLQEFAEHRFGDELEYVLECVYRAMHYAREDASSTRSLR